MAGCLVILLDTVDTGTMLIGLVCVELFKRDMQCAGLLAGNPALAEALKDRVSRLTMHPMGAIATKACAIEDGEKEM